MAGIDASIYGNAQAPQQMSLGDMLGIAAGATAYQKQKALLEPSIAKGQAESEEAKIRLNNAQLENTRKHYENISQNTADLMTKPDLSVNDIIERASQINANAGGNERSLKQYLAGLPQNAKPIELKAWLAQAQAKSLSALAQIEKQYPAGILPGQMTQLGTNEPIGQTAKTEEKPTLELQYPVRNPQNPYLPLPGEKEASDVGAAYTTHANAVAGQLPTIKRNNSELISSIKDLQKDVPQWAQGGPAGLARMKYMEVTNDPRYAQVKKNLANVVAAQVKAYGGQGLSTDAGKALTAASTGTETMPLDVLLNTAYRSLGDIKSSELEAQALSKFTKRFGTNNVGAFQKAWGENADTDVLQLKAMEDMGADKEDIDEFVFKGKSKDAIKKLIEKEKRLEQLVNKGYL